MCWTIGKWKKYSYFFQNNSLGQLGIGNSWFTLRTFLSFCTIKEANKYIKMEIVSQKNKCSFQKWARYAPNLIGLTLDLLCGYFFLWIYFFAQGLQDIWLGRIKHRGTEEMLSKLIDVLVEIYLKYPKLKTCKTGRNRWLYYVDFFFVILCYFKE